MGRTDDRANRGLQAKVALAAVKGDRTIAQLAEHFTSTPIRLPPEKPSWRAVFPEFSDLGTWRRRRLRELTLENDVLEGAPIKVGLLSAKR